MSRLLRGAAIVAAITVISGCSAVAATKSGGGTAPETVAVALAEQDGTPADGDAQAFARALAEASGGQLTAEVRTRAHLGADGEPPAAYDDDIPYHAVLDQLLHGRVELALLPDFIWAEGGAPGIAALKAPGVIDSDPLLLRVAEELGADAIAGLRDLGVEPLALLPESLRHPVTFDVPLRTAADFGDRGMRIVDPFVGEALAALGADPQRLELTYPLAVADGTVTGAESAFVQVATLPASAIYTSDLMLGAKFNVIAAGGEWFAGLSEQERGWVEQAARVASEDALATYESELSAAAAYCAIGGSVVHAGDDARAEVRAAFAPLVERVASAAETRGLMSRIQALKSEMEPPVYAPECAAPPVETAEPAPDEAASGGGAFPEGTYRARLTIEDFTDVGVDLVTARNHAQIWTLTFRDGQLVDLDCPGSTYTVTGDRISVMLGTGHPGCGDIPGQELFGARWTLVGDALRFTDFSPTPMGPSMQTFNETLWGSKDWIRVR